MRVLQIIADGSPGGGTTHVLQILGASELCEEAALITEPGSYLAAAARGIGTECIEIDLFGAGQFLHAPRRLKRAIAAHRPDLIHAHGSRAGFLTALANPPVPLVYTVHGLHILHRPAPLRWLGIAAEKVTKQRANLTVFVSQADRGQALSHGLLPDNNQAIVIHNGIRLRGAIPTAPAVTRHLGFVGRLEAQKDPCLFLRVVDRLPGFEATMIGWGAMGPDIERAIAHRLTTRVRMMGALTHEETIESMRGFGVLVMPSLWEPFGLVALEAMDLGVPVVATRVGGLQEIIEDGTSGFLVDDRSPDKLAQAVLRLTEDLFLRQRVIEAGQRRVREHFSEERMLASIERVYRNVLDARSCSG